MLHNDKNTPPFPVMQGPVIPIPSNEKSIAGAAATAIESVGCNDRNDEHHGNRVGIRSRHRFVDQSCCRTAGLTRAAAVTTVNPLAEDYLVGAPVVGHSLPCGVAEGFVGSAKAVLIGRAALDDLLARCGGRLSNGPGCMPSSPTASCSMRRGTRAKTIKGSTKKTTTPLCRRSCQRGMEGREAIPVVAPGSHVALTGLAASPVLRWPRSHRPGGD